MQSREQFAYLAGMIDGEGTIALHRHKQHRREHWQYRPRIIVVNTVPEALEYLRLIFGGRLVVHTRRAGEKPLYQWRMIAIQEVKRILDGCLPFLIIKRERALALLRFAESRLDAPRSPYGDIEDGVFAELHRLNRRSAA